MARVNVEQKALTDPRFDLLGRFLESDRHGAIGRMVLVWNECQERTTYTLPERLVGAIMGHRDGASWLCECDLATWIDEQTVRIKGTEGRIEWLNRKRMAAQTNGLKGGRPPTSLVSQETKDKPTSVSSGYPQETPPAPAPPPARKDRAYRPPFVPPTVAEVSEYVLTRTKRIDPERFVDHYTANGWVQSRGKPIVDWKAAVRNWEKNNFSSGPSADEDERHAANMRKQTADILREQQERAKLSEDDDAPAF